eukprot:scaffold95600_cov78-Phaeocystis_antarctica.AAC.2
MAPGVASSKRRAPFQREAHFLSGHRAQARGAGLPPLSPPRQALQLRTILRALAGFRKLDLHLRTIMYLLECTQLIPSVPQGTLVPRLPGSLNDRTKRSIAHK